MTSKNIKCECCGFESEDDSDFVITSDIHKQLKKTHNTVCNDCANVIKDKLNSGRYGKK